MNSTRNPLQFKIPRNNRILGFKKKKRYTTKITENRFIFGYFINNKVIKIWYEKRYVYYVNINKIYVSFRLFMF